MRKENRVWNFYAPVYDLFMRQNRAAYEEMYARIRDRVVGKRVLELCTGTGLIARNVAGAAREMIATDFAEKMLREAQKGDVPANLAFRQADATDIPFEDSGFDVVIISNALHIIQSPEKALSEIHRVLRPDGMLIAPNFLGHSGGGKAGFLAKLLTAAGVTFEVTWDEAGYAVFGVRGGVGVAAVGFEHFALGSLVPLTYKYTIDAGVSADAAATIALRWGAWLTPMNVVLLGLLWRLVFRGTNIEGAWGACESLGEGLMYLAAYLYWRKEAKA